MGILTRRDRIVTFRVSAEEYQALRDYCCSVGARSVSDFARAAVYEVMGSTQTGVNPLLDQIRVLAREHGELTRKVSELSGRLDACDRRPEK